MKGELLEVWSETWREIWAKLAKYPEFGDDLLPDLCREFIAEPLPPNAPPPPKVYSEDGELVLPEDVDARDNYERAFAVFSRERARYEESVSGGALSRAACRAALKAQVKNETDAVATLERAYIVISSYGDDAFSNKYFLLVEKFLAKYSLRFDLRRPFSLHPTLPGVFSRLIGELRHATAQDANLSALMHEFDESVRDLRNDRSSGKIKVCILKQMNLLEAIAQRCPGVTAQSLGGMCDQVNTWPHVTVRDAMKKLYGFASDYPGIRHGGNPASAIRAIEMRDMIAVSVMLAGFVPYLSDRLDSKNIYRGARE